MDTRGNHHILKDKIIPVLIITIVVFLFWYSASLHDMLLSIADRLEEYAHTYPLFARTLFVGFATLSGVVSLFSSVALVPVAVIIWGSSETVVLLVSGWIIGNIITYTIGRYGAHPLIGRFLPEEKIALYRQKIPPRSELGLLFLFRFITPAEITGYLLGLMRYEFGKYLLITVFSEIPIAILAVYLGEAVIVGKQAVFWGGGILVAVLFVLLYMWFHHRQKNLS